MIESSTSNFWLLLAAIARRKRMIMTLVLITTIVAAAVSMILPKWYQSSSLILPTENDALPIGQLTSQRNLNSISGLITLSGIVTPADVYTSMLRSRRIADTLISRFDLKQRYRVGTKSDAHLALASHSQFSVTDEGLLSIKVEDRDPDTAAALVNAYVDELRVVLKQLLTSRAKQKREFIEERLKEIRTNLDSARNSLEYFQTENRTIDFSAQIRLAMEQAIQLKIDFSKVAVDLELERQLRGNENPKVIQLQRQSDAISRQLSLLEDGSGGSSFFSVPLSEMPGLQGEYEVLYSQVRVTESLYEILLEQLEQAKIKESERTPSFSILDKAEAPEFRNRPQRTLIVMLAFGLALIFSVLLALSLNYIEGLAESSDEESKLALYVISSFFGWLPGIKRLSGTSGHAPSEGRMNSGQEKVD